MCPNSTHIYHCVEVVKPNDGEYDGTSGNRYIRRPNNTRSGEWQKQGDSTALDDSFLRLCIKPDSIDTSGLWNTFDGKPGGLHNHQHVDWANSSRQK